MQIFGIIPEVKIIGGKMSITSVNGAWGIWGFPETPVKVLGDGAL